MAGNGARFSYLERYYIYIITQRPASSQSLITEETNTHTMKKGVRDLNMVNGALLIFSSSLPNRVFAPPTSPTPNN
jgi:transposase